MKRWFGGKQVGENEFETHQSRLLQLSRGVLQQYMSDMDKELAEPTRLEAVYGSGFTETTFREQAELIVLTAARTLDVPSGDVNLVLPTVQQAVASVRHGEIVKPGTSILTDSYCKHVIATGRELSVEISAEHPLVCDTSFALRGEIVSYLGVPIAEPGGLIVGVLCVWSGDHREWTVSDVHLLTQMSFTLTRFLHKVTDPHE